MAASVQKTSAFIAEKGADAKKPIIISLQNNQTVSSHNAADKTIGLNRLAPRADLYTDKTMFYPPPLGLPPSTVGNGKKVEGNQIIEISDENQLNSMLNAMESKIRVEVLKRNRWLNMYKWLLIVGFAYILTHGFIMAIK